MSIFDVSVYTGRGNQKISERFLKKMGFHKDYWGSPHEDYKKPCSLFWEKYIFDIDDFVDGEQRIVATIWYFPETFTGYVTPYNIRGKNPANGTLCQVNDADLFEKRLYSHCKADILYAIDLMNQKLKEFNIK